MALYKNTVSTIRAISWFRAKKQGVFHPLFCAPILTISPCGVIVRIGAFVASFAWVFQEKPATTMLNRSGIFFERIVSSAGRL